MITPLQAYNIADSFREVVPTLEEISKQVEQAARGGKFELKFNFPNPNNLEISFKKKIYRHLEKIGYTVSPIREDYNTFMIHWDIRAEEPQYPMDNGISLPHF